jgi:hypothetical protein
MIAATGTGPPVVTQAQTAERADQPRQASAARAITISATCRVIDAGIRPPVYLQTTMERHALYGSTPSHLKIINPTTPATA